MKSFTVTLHAEDRIQEMKVDKLSGQDYELATEGGTRHLFDLDTNIGFFVFFDCEDNKGRVSHLVLHFEEGSEEASACYGFDLKDFYEFTALYLNDLEFNEELNEEEGEYGPIHHLAHLLYHITEEGKGVLT